LNLSHPAELRRFLTRHGISADKSLGQHFLCSDSVVEAMVERVADLGGILEIGPGPGILTTHLAAWDRRLIALEVDGRMISALKESAPYADVRHADALQTDFSELLRELPEPRGIVGNLPYYITGPLVDRVAEARASFSIAVLMMQKEVADRIAAPPLDAARGSLSVYLQALFEIEVVVQVPQTAFEPPPKVKSTVLEFRPRLGFEIADSVFRLVRLGFAQPRKTLANNLASGLKIDRAKVSETLEAVGLRPDARPHMLTLAEWVWVAQLLEQAG
jgi:16S rRNA (adenine1518-N6/adenine1519-N6)-dimethyltransferase